MAVAYAAIANGGDIVTPHVGLRVESPDGQTIQEIAPPVREHVDIDPAAQRTIMEGLHDAAMIPDGTSYPVFGSYPVQIAGKTGTAERGLCEEDQSWYMALAPYDNPKYVVAVTVERGGFGADSAAPVAKRSSTSCLRSSTSGSQATGLAEWRASEPSRLVGRRWRPIAARARTPTGPLARAWSSASGSRSSIRSCCSQRSR